MVSSLVLRDLLDPRWHKLLAPSLNLLDELEGVCDFAKSAPTRENIFRAFNCEPASVKVLIVGQDPYPNSDHAMGLSFSVPANVKKIPPSLRNIFTEMLSDVGGSAPSNGNLAYLADQGVMLLNRCLTINLPDKKVDGRWHGFTDQVARVLAEQGVIGIFWGSHAQELAHYFPKDKRIIGVHPSPLSAYRGFFGSKPFSSVNRILKSENRSIIEWTKQ
ncbi:MAG: uracil-DNA glycosylase [Actinobacteria bacterium]|nr:uracil-DNA glycosylase [Actinomycetota bacterium]